MADLLFQDTKLQDLKRSPRKKGVGEKVLWTILLIISFLIIGNLQLRSDTGASAAYIKNSFRDYEKNIFQMYSYIEYTDTIEFKKMTKNRCITHYIKTEYYKIDLKKRRIYSMILDFNLIEGKNEKKRYIGKETDVSLKELYLFSEYSNKKWTQPFIDDHEAYVTFKLSKWFIPLHITMHYDEQIYFPQEIQVISENGNIDINLYYAQFSGIYMLDSMESDILVDIALVKYHMQTQLTRSHYTFTR